MFTFSSVWKLSSSSQGLRQPDPESCKPNCGRRIWCSCCAISCSKIFQRPPTHYQTPELLDQCTLISNRRIITHVQDYHHLPATITQRNLPILPSKESPASLNATHPATSRALVAYHHVYICPSVF